MQGLSNLERVRGNFWIASTENLSKREIRRFVDGIQVDGDVRID
jgi:hypothetical protein